MNARCASRRRPLRALQVEVTSRCTRSCAVCPRQGLADRWVAHDLSAAAWAAIVPALPLVEHVHLQGWGEPLLHRDLPEMAARAKAAGCTVGITTNGDLLGAAIDWIVDLRLDMVTLSVGGGGGHHAMLRDGSDLASALRQAGELAARAVRGRPRVQLAYLLTQDNHRELEEVVRLAARSALREMFVTHLDCTPVARLLAAAAFSAAGLREGVNESLARAHTAASRCRVRLRTPPDAPEELLVCALDPTRLAFVAADGRVGPCVYLLLPISGRIPRVDFGGSREIEPCSYGSIPEESLEEVLAAPARRRFVAPFVARLAAEDAFRECGFGGIGTPALAALDAADRERTRALADNPFPRGCSGCHKMAGW